MYEIFPTKQYQKSLRKIKQSGKLPKEKLDNMVQMLANNKIIPAQYRDHELKGEYQGFRECHIQGDLLLVYKKEKKKLILILADIGSHAYLFE
jgi:mRNA interferase YafQ